jgi:hypothetical protein
LHLLHLLQLLMRQQLPQTHCQGLQQLLLAVVSWAAGCRSHWLLKSCMAAGTAAALQLLPWPLKVRLGAAGVVLWMLLPRQQLLMHRRREAACVQRVGKCSSRVHVGCD